MIIWAWTSKQLTVYAVPVIGFVNHDELLTAGVLVFLAHQSTQQTITEYELNNPPKCVNRDSEKLCFKNLVNRKRTENCRWIVQS